ncbi:hypothetical protein DVH24_024896 [Malus domestica]|uniref:Uncharacterized protein n=1 Tax=Malus domestica TaxID=3750 RepID=A0A498JNQ8_MALDO|nr:hypothetical protein DVH24_024896 [Malus domestica]
MGGKNSSRRRDHERDDGGSRDWERRIRRRSSSYDVDKERYHQMSENRGIRARREDTDGDAREKDYEEKESKKRKDIGGNEQNADQGLSGGGVHLSAMELEVLKAKEERLAKKKIVADVCDDILAWKNNAEKEKASQLSKELDNVGEISEEDEDEDDIVIT